MQIHKDGKKILSCKWDIRVVNKDILCLEFWSVGRGVAVISIALNRWHYTTVIQVFKLFIVRSGIQYCEGVSVVVNTPCCVYRINTRCSVHNTHLSPATMVWPLTRWQAWSKVSSAMCVVMFQSSRLTRMSHLCLLYSIWYHWIISAVHAPTLGHFNERTRVLYTHLLILNCVFVMS